MKDASTRAPARGLPSGPGVPEGGAVRVGFDPAALPPLTDDPGPSRYDDPRPRTLDRYRMRYTARTVRGVLLELLDHLRPPVADAVARESAVVDDDDLSDLRRADEPVPADQTEPWRAVEDFLVGRRVGTVQVPPGTWVVSVHGALIQSVLNRAIGVRALLDSPQGRRQVLPAGARGRGQPRLDEAAVRLSSEFGRLLTQAISLDLRDRSPRPDAIHYRSRHDDTEDCWAIYDHADVTVTGIRPLSPGHPADRAAMRDVALMWDLLLPPRWR